MGYFSTTTWVEEMAEVTPQQFGYLLSRRRTEEERVKGLGDAIKEAIGLFRYCNNVNHGIEKCNVRRYEDQFGLFNSRVLVAVNYCRFMCLLIDGTWKCYQADYKLKDIGSDRFATEFPRGILRFCISMAGYNDDKVIEFDNR